MSAGKSFVVRLRGSGVDETTTSTTRDSAGGKGEEEQHRPLPFRVKLSGQESGREGKSAGQLGEGREARSPFSAYKDELVTIGLRCSVLGCVWLAGAMGLSCAWLLLLVAAVMTWERRKRMTLRKAKMGQHLDDEHLVLAHTRELPSWVNFPDVNRAEWVNTIISRIWPHLEGAIEKILVEKVEPVLKRKCPGPLKGAHFQTVKLGKISPRVTGIKVYPQESIDQREVVIDVDLAYNGTSEVELFFKYGITVGISHVKFHGKLRIVLRPLMPVLPLVGAIILSFMEKPDFDFDLTGLANVLDMPVLRQTLDSAVREKLSEVLVFPNQVVLSLLRDESKLQDVLYPEFSGFLSVTVVEAQDVMGMDFNLFRSRTSDLYATVQVSRNHFATKVVHKAVSAVWNETFEAVLLRNEEPAVTIKLWDEEFSGDALIGCCQISVEDVQCSKDLWLDVHADGSAGVRGRVHAKILWRRIANASESAPVLKERTDSHQVKKMTSEELELGNTKPCSHQPTSKQQRAPGNDSKVDGRSTLAFASTRSAGAEAARDHKFPPKRQLSVLERIKQTVSDSTSRPGHKQLTDATRSQHACLVARNTTKIDSRFSSTQNDAGACSEDVLDSDLTTDEAGEETAEDSSLDVDSRTVPSSPRNPTAVLLVHLIRTQGLKSLATKVPQQEYYCRLALEGIEGASKKSKTVVAAETATWNCSVHFSLKVLCRQQLLVELCTQTDTVVGTLQLGIADILEAEALTSQGRFTLSTGTVSAEEENALTLELRLSLRALMREDVMVGSQPLDEESDTEDDTKLEPAVDVMAHDLPPASLALAASLKEEQTSMASESKDDYPLASPITHLPNRQISDSCIEVSFRYSHLKNRLYINVHRAQSLVPCHVDGTSDPFVEAFVLPDSMALGRRRTSTRRKTCDPVFNENFQYPVPYSQLHCLSILLVIRNSPFRYGAFRHQMGEALIGLKAVNFASSDRVWFPLTSRAETERNISAVDIVMGTLSYSVPAYESG